MKTILGVTSVLLMIVSLAVLSLNTIKTESQFDDCDSSYSDV